MDLSIQLSKGKERTAVRLVNNISPNSDYATIQLQAVYVRNIQDKSHTSIGWYDNYYQDKHKYKGLLIECIMDGKSDEPYDFKLGISRSVTGILSLDDAQNAVKSLKVIERKIENLSVLEGHYSSFEEYVMRFTRAINAKSYYVEAGQGSDYVRFDTIGYLRNAVLDQVESNIRILKARQQKCIA